MVAHEASLEECQIQEEEARQAETFHEDPREELLDEEMDDDERGDPEPSGPCAEADKEDLPPPLEEGSPIPLEPQNDVITPEEEALLMQPVSLSGGPTAGSQSPRSEAGMVSGELAELNIASPSQTKPRGDETPQ